MSDYDAGKLAAAAAADKATTDAADRIADAALKPREVNHTKSAGIICIVQHTI